MKRQQKNKKRKPKAKPVKEQKAAASTEAQINAGPGTTLMFSIAYDASRDKWIVAGYDKPKEGEDRLSYAILGEGDYSGVVHYLDKAWGSDFLHRIVDDLKIRYGGVVPEKGSEDE